MMEFDRNSIIAQPGGQRPSLRLHAGGKKRRNKEARKQKGEGGKSIAQTHTAQHKTANDNKQAAATMCLL
jgi:hypothetical protein